MPLALQLGAALDVVLERRVAAVDEDVALVQQRRELVDRRLRRVAVGQHDPDRPRRRERLDDVGELPDRLGALGAELLGLGVGAVPDHHAVAAAQQPPRHVAAHAAQPDHRYVHLVLLVCRARAGVVTSVWERPRDQRAEPLDPGDHVVAEAHAERAAAVRPQGAQVTARLRPLEHAEAVRLAGDVHVLRVVPDELQEQPLVRPALVELAGRVQKARAVAQRGRQAQAGRARYRRSACRSSQTASPGAT